MSIRGLVLPDISVWGGTLDRQVIDGIGNLLLMMVLTIVDLDELNTSVLTGRIFFGQSFFQNSRLMPVSEV